MKRFLLALCFLLMASTAQAVTYYVDDTGSNSNCTTIQTEGTPGLTINFALDCAGAAGTEEGAGDTVIVKAGTYAELITNNIPSGSLGNLFVLKCETIRACTIQAPGAANELISMISGSSRNIEINGFVIDGNNVAVDCLRTSGGAAGTHFNLRYLNNEIKNCTQQGIQSSGTDDVLVRGNFIHDIAAGSGSNAFHCLYSSSFDRNWIIERNTFDTCSGYGVHIYHPTNPPTGHIIRFNISRNMETRSGVILYGSGHLVHNNILTGNALGGIRVATSASNAKIYQNTIYNNTVGIDKAGAGAAECRNNIVLSSASMTGCGTTSDNLTTGTAADIWIDPAAGDFNLKEASVAIDNAATISGFTTHGCLDDTDEADGAGTCDQGAFEAPVRLSAVVEDATPTIYSVTYSMPSQGARDGVGLQTCTVANWDVQVAGAPATENSCVVTGTGRVDVTLASAVTNGQALTDAMTRSAVPTLTDNLAIGDPNGTLWTHFFHTKSRSHTAKNGTNNVGGAGGAAFAALHFRCLSWYADTSPTSTDWLRAEDDATNKCSIQPGGLAAVAVAIDCTGANCDPQSFEWHANRNAGAYAAMTDTASATAIAFAGVNAESLGDGEAISATILTDPYSSFVAGSVVGQQSSQPTVDLSQNSITNAVILIKSHADTEVGETYCIQPAKAGGATTTVTQTKTACFEVVNPAAGF